MELPNTLRAYFITDRKAVFDSMQEAPVHTTFNYSGRFYKVPGSPEEVETRLKRVLVADISKLSVNIILSLLCLFVITKISKTNK